MLTIRALLADRRRILLLDGTPSTYIHLVTTRSIWRQQWTRAPYNCICGRIFVFYRIRIYKRLLTDYRRTATVNPDELGPDFFFDCLVVYFDDKICANLRLLQLSLSCTFRATCVSLTTGSKHSCLLHDYTVVHLQCIISDWTWWQNSYSIIGALIDFINYFLVGSLADLICDETLPFEEPVRAYHIPSIARFLLLLSSLLFFLCFFVFSAI